MVINRCQNAASLFINHWQVKCTVNYKQKRRTGGSGTASGRRRTRCGRVDWTGRMVGQCRTASRRSTCRQAASGAPKGRGNGRWRDRRLAQCGSDSILCHRHRRVPLAGMRRRAPPLSGGWRSGLPGLPVHGPHAADRVRGKRPVRRGWRPVRTSRSRRRQPSRAHDRARTAARVARRGLAVQFVTTWPRRSAVAPH